MKKIYRFFEIMFSEKINNAVCWTVLALAGLFIALQFVRYIGRILIL
jgi:hypothetical protein